MFDVNGQSIRIPRGDSAELSFDLIGEDTGQPYLLQNSQYAVFGVFPVRGADAVIKKTVAEQTESGAVIVSLSPTDTDIPRMKYLYTLRIFNTDGTEIDTLAGFPETACFEVV